MKQILLILLPLFAACSSSYEGDADLAECSDTLDNDGDGLIDCDDPDCITRGACDGDRDTGFNDPSTGPDFCDPCTGESTAWAQVQAAEELTCALDGAGWGYCFGEEESTQLDIPAVQMTQWQ